MLSLTLSTLLALFAISYSNDLNDYESSDAVTYWTASVESGGASGYFNMELSDEKAKYDYRLDLTNLNLQDCNIANGLSYHIHATWDDSLGASSTTCTGAGGHYDPTLACGPSTAETSKCASLGRTSTAGYKYGCNKNNFTTEGRQYICEVGDLSGKFGHMYPTSDDYIFEGEIEYDPLPATAANFRKTTGIAPPWASLVIHCPASGNRLVCALFTQTYPSNSDSDGDTLSGGAIAGILIAVTSVLGIGAFAVYYFIFRKSAGGMNKNLMPL